MASAFCISLRFIDIPNHSTTALILSGVIGKVVSLITALVIVAFYPRFVSSDVVLAITA
jgi:hypothetical protein